MGIKQILDHKLANCRLLDNSYQVIMLSNILTNLGNCVSPRNMLVQIFYRGYGSCRNNWSPPAFGSTVESTNI